MPTISVIIPCLNEEKFLGDLLSDLAAQTTKPEEVIVADCNSEDKTTALAESYKNKLPIKIARSKIRSPGAARNAGVAIAVGEYLAFVDADMRIPKDAIAKIKTSLEKEPVDFLTPRFISDGETAVDTLHIWIIYWWIKINVDWLRRPTGIGGMMCVKSSVNKIIGGFDAEHAFQDDRRYIEELRNLHASCKYLSDLILITSSRRFAGKGFLSSGLAKILQDSRVLRSWSEKISKKFGNDKKYGHYK